MPPNLPSIAGPPEGDSIKRLTSTHQTIMELVLMGRKQAEIASLLDRNPNSISRIVNSPAFQNELAKKRQLREQELAAVEAEQRLDAMRILEENAHLAARKLVELTEDPDAKVSLSAAREILSITHGKKETGAKVVVLEPGSIQVLLAALAESGARPLEAGPAHDADSETSGSGSS